MPNIIKILFENYKSYISTIYKNIKIYEDFNQKILNASEVDLSFNNQQNINENKDKTLYIKNYKECSIKDITTNIDLFKLKSFIIYDEKELSKIICNYDILKSLDKDINYYVNNDYIILTILCILNKEFYINMSIFEYLYYNSLYTVDKNNIKLLGFENKYSINSLLNINNIVNINYYNYYKLNKNNDKFNLVFDKYKNIYNNYSLYINNNIYKDILMQTYNYDIINYIKAFIKYINNNQKIPLNVYNKYINNININDIQAIKYNIKESNILNNNVSYENKLCEKIYNKNDEIDYVIYKSY